MTLTLCLALEYRAGSGRLHSKLLLFPESALSLITGTTWDERWVKWVIPFVMGFEGYGEGLLSQIALLSHPVTVLK